MNSGPDSRQELDPDLRRALLERLRRFYERELSEGQSAYFNHVGGTLRPTRMGRHWLAEHRALFNRLLALEPQERFLDVGCAEGYYTLDLASRAATTVAVDVSMSVLRFLGGLRDFPAARLRRVLSDVERLPFGDGCFDKALCSHLLEHVLDDRAVIADLYRVLRPGSTAVFAIPLKYTFQHRLLRTAEGWARRLLRPGKKPYPVAPPGETRPSTGGGPSPRPTLFGRSVPPPSRGGGLHRDGIAGRLASRSPQLARASDPAQPLHLSDGDLPQQAVALARSRPRGERSSAVKSSPSGRRRSR